MEVKIKMNFLNDIARKVRNRHRELPLKRSNVGDNMFEIIEKAKKEQKRIDAFRKLVWAKMCPNCNGRIVSPYNKCELCGWEENPVIHFGTIKDGYIWDPVRGEAVKKNEVGRKRNRYIPKRVQREVWRRDQGRCVECGSQENLEFDHIIPFSKGGSNTTRNIQLLCEVCNKLKHNKVGDEK